MNMAFGISLQNNPYKVNARLQNSLFSFSSITLKKVLRDTLQNILTLILVDLISAALYFNVFYKYLSNKKLLRILPCQKFHLS